jgi:histidine triad (HIT) family protein
MTAENDCLFCKMAAGEIPVNTVYEDDVVFVLNDIAPRAPVHMLLIPKQHIESARSLDEQAHAPLLGHMVAVANRMAEQRGVKERGFRLTFNVGDEGGQTIYHLHLHVLGGQKLGPEG